MHTVIGIDAATQARNVGLARSVADGSRLEVEEALTPASNAEAVETVARWCEGPTLLAIDAPLGWPRAMGRALASHRAGDAIEAPAQDVFRRLTDDRVHEIFRKRPLDVGSNLIARTAHAALALLAGVRERTGETIPLAWSPSEAARVRAIEVYPAATLRARGLSDSGYKGKGPSETAARKGLLDALSDEIRSGRDVRASAAETDHVLDAILCGLAGSDFLAGQGMPPREEEHDRVRHEGWIWVRPAVRD
jgi:predicted RNase H-like nuclease